MPSACDSPRSARASRLPNRPDAKCGGVRCRHACQTCEVSETCYCYPATAREENARVADWLVRLTIACRDWGLGLCFLHLRNVKGFG